MSLTQRITNGIEAALDVIGEPLVQAALVIVLGIIAGFVIGRLITRLLILIGVPTLVEGTATERWLQRTGTSTVVFIGRLVSLFIYIGATLAAFLLIGALDAQVFWRLATAWLPHLFVAIIVLTIGVVLADKIEILVSERLQGIKLPDVTIIPLIVKYSIIFVALLIALGQIGVDTNALLILLSVYVFGFVFLGAIALRDFLASGAAGIYLLLREPFSIGDEVTFDGASGIVQEVDVFVTRIEDEQTEYVVPNRHLMQSGVQRTRSDSD